MGYRSARLALTALFALGLASSGCAMQQASASEADPSAPEASTGERASASIFHYSDTPTATAGGGWVNNYFPQQSSKVTIEFDAQPQTPTGDGALDAVIGLSSGKATGFSSLAAAVRFNPNGYIDARKGGAYAADNQLAYHSAWQFYHFAITVDFATHTYSVSANEHGYAAVQIATNYPFRTEQSSLGRLDNIGQDVDSSTGSVLVSDLQVDNYNPDLHASDTTGWATETFPSQSGHFAVEFEADPISSAQLDAVAGLSKGAPTSFASIAAGIRFAPTGLVDARNGSSYAYQTSVSYKLGDKFTIHLDVDLATHTYSATVRKTGDANWYTIANHYAFRTEQAGVTSLDHVSTKVDGSDSQGDIYVYSTTIDY